MGITIARTRHAKAEDILHEINEADWQIIAAHILDLLNAWGDFIGLYTDGKLDAEAAIAILKRTKEAGLSQVTYDVLDQIGQSDDVFYTFGD